MKKYTAFDALKNHRNNKYNKWTGTGKDKALLASERLENILFEPHIVPEFEFSKNDKVFTVGSCFARGLENALLADRVKILSVSKEFDVYPLAQQGATRQGYMNKYNVYSIYYEFLWALEDNNRGEYFIKLSDGVYYDLNTNATLFPDSYEITLERRQILNKIFKKVLECDILTITLGLIEVWFDKENNLYLNNIPHPRLLSKYPNRFEVRFLDFDENLQVLESLYKLLLKHNNNINIVVTVSPIPLQTTFSKDDVVVANMFSKSTLRAVATKWAELHENVHYFPSYEIALLSDQKLVWESDRRHLKGPVTQYIMEVFKKYYLKGYTKWQNKMITFEDKINQD